VVAFIQGTELLGQSGSLYTAKLSCWNDVVAFIQRN
jgi:hypothetical protein